MLTPTLRLPWPPSVNDFYRSVGRGKVLISATGREYIATVGGHVRLQQPRWVTLTGRIGVELLVTVPDRRRRDLDNLLKPLLDCLTKSHVWADDCQIDRITIERGPIQQPGWIDIVITERPT